MGMDSRNLGMESVPARLFERLDFGTSILGGLRKSIVLQTLMVKGGARAQ